MYLGNFLEPAVRLEALAALLDTSGHIARVRAVRGLDRAALARLYEAAAPTDESTGLTLDFLVPAGTDAQREVIHHGKNSLPLFNHFQKRFCLPAAPPGGESTEPAERVLWGYNEGSTRPFIGPGYFLAKPHGAKELVVDYGSVPPRSPPGWPEIIPNSARLGRFVWVGMRDVLRRVSEHVSIGRAYKSERPMDAWFALCRQDPTVT